jgi:hypothetical protein
VFALAWQKMNYDLTPPFIAHNIKLFIIKLLYAHILMCAKIETFDAPQNYPMFAVFSEKGHAFIIRSQQWQRIHSVIIGY